MKKTVLAVIAAGMAFAGISCSSDMSEPESEPVSGVEIRTAEAIHAGVSHSFPGKIESVNRAGLSTIVMGTITMLDVTEGDAVTEGDLLVRIDDNQIRAQRMQLQANMMQAEAHLKHVSNNFERISNLYEKESATSRELDEITAAYQAAQANVKALEAGFDEIDEMFRYTEIRAPFDGVVSSKFFNRGDLAAPGHPILTISDPSSLKITSNVPEALIGNVHKGMTITYSIPSAGVTDREATLTSVNSSGDMMSNQFSIEALLDSGEDLNGLKPGMYVNVKAELDETASVRVPESALIHRGQLTGVFALSDENRAVLRWIRTGHAGAEGVEVISGLAPGERYLVSWPAELRQGQKIAVN